jgi:hypothetical protein
MKQSRQRMDVMSDDKKHAPPHDRFVSLEQNWEAEYWAKIFSVTRDRLATAIGQVGHSAEALEKYLKRG